MAESFIAEIDEKIKSITGSIHDLQPIDFLIPTENKNALVVSEAESFVDVAVCIRKDLLERLSGKSFPRDFDLQLLPDISVVVEELSHFNRYCDHAMRNQPLSALELELQAEVDKFAFALECLHERNENHLREQIFSVLFDECKLGDWVTDEEVERYQKAHEVARAFCRSILDQSKAGSTERQLFQDFFSSTYEERISIRSK
ncbi:MAG: hypothetical protein COV44_07250 [Deltaproteobacteria bacterium CG11_big_fil_rev_8_21_14_0_20_45_16]|nr:MAG: hypothetical protein COV44_07250 [Deltaproteobacteria bacterium CG11_big_fil_rev_8_21_14_0_20_45_16]